MQHEATVFVVDDDPAVRKSLRWLLDSVDMPMVAFASASEFLEKYDPSAPGCMILDIRMPGISGLDLQAMLGAKGISLPVIVVTGHGDVPTAVRAMKQGAIDLIEKPYNDQVMLDLIQRCIQRDLEQRQRSTKRLEAQRHLEFLTQRENDVLDLILAGKTNKEMARALDISPKTVEAHRAKIMDKTGSASLPALVEISLLARGLEES